MSGAFAEKDVNPVGIDLEHGNVEGATTQIVDEHPAPHALGVGIIQRGSGRFVDDPAHL